MALKGGFVATDRRLDRVPAKDPASRGFGIMTLLPGDVRDTLRSYTWPLDVWLNQGEEGRCVEFSICHELLATPVKVDTLKVLDILQHMKIYHPAQHDDYWSGCYLGPRCPISPSPDQYEGTSVLHGIKQAKALGFFGEYRWAFGVEQLVAAVGYHGPAVIGVDWWTGMFNTDASGFVRLTGQIEGGHAILVIGIRVVFKAGATGKSFADLDLDRSYFTLHNSWGKGWGINGRCRVSVRDMQTLLKAGGECCLPVVRNK